MNFFFLSLPFVSTVLGKLADLPSRSPIQPRIYGGDLITIDQAPYMVALILKNVFRCGGSVISNQWILTAGHCVKDERFIAKPSEITIRVGSSYFRYGGKLLNVTEIIIHPEYIWATISYDCALLKLADKLEFEKNIQPVSLPNQYEEIASPVKCFVSGWGITEFSNKTQQQLRGVEVPIVDYKICKQQLPIINPENICTGYEKGGKNACQGDSGGPLLCNNKIFGIVSGGDPKGCALPNSSAVYVNVVYVRDWIKENAGV